MLFLLYSGDQVKGDEMSRAHGKWWKRNACRVLVGKHGGKRVLGRLRCRRENNM